MDENSPGETIAESINSAIDEARAQEQSSTDYAHEQMKLEQQRIKAEERIAERNAERDEHIAELQTGGDMREMFSSLMAKLDNFLANNTPQTAVHVEHEVNEIPPASEDVPQEAEETVENPENAAAESVEELGETAEETEKETEEPEETVENATKFGRSRRRNRRR